MKIIHPATKRRALLHASVAAMALAGITPAFAAEDTAADASAANPVADDAEGGYGAPILVTARRRSR